MFRPFLQKIRKGFHDHVSASRGAVPALINHVEFAEEMNVATPESFSKGYFTVFAVQGKEMQRFVVEVDNLTNPAFLHLLEQAQEEYGFEQQGALSLPCRPDELERILEDWKAEHSDHDTEDLWATCNATTMPGY